MDGGAPGPQAKLSPTPLAGTNRGRAPVVSVVLRGRVTSIVPITAPSSRAVTTFPTLSAAFNLNAPGPVNNTTTGDCGYCFQVLFNLAAIDSNDVSLIRIVSRTTVLGGKQSTLEKSDGPSAPSIVRPSGSLIAVADCPGLFASSATPDPTAFPMSYHAHFILSAHDSAQSMAVLAKISYDINLDKKAIDDPSPSMVFNVTDQQIF